jgi:hypothetical protein
MLITRKIFKPVLLCRKMTESQKNSEIPSQLSGYEVMRYYIPLCLRPTVPVTIEMLDKIEPLDSDKPHVKEFKTKLHNELVNYLGGDIMQYSQHLNQGIMIRSGIYLSTFYHITDMNHMPLDILALFTTTFLISYGIFTMLMLDNVFLHQKYINLTK